MAESDAEALERAYPDAYRIGRVLGPGAKPIVIV
jgi:hypothetical protein